MGELSEREIANRKIALHAAEEGFVLLKNDGLLPLKKDIPLAIFGGGANYTIKGGTGSGDVNERESISLYSGLKDKGFTITNKAWLDSYDKIYNEARMLWKEAVLAKCNGNSEDPHFFDAHATTPWRMPAVPQISKEDLNGAKYAIYVISRSAGEGADRRDVKGDYYLSDTEESELKALSSLAEKLIIVINTGAQIDLTFIHSLKNVSSIIFICQAGQEGGRAFANILCGASCPSGRLTATWAKKYEDFPGSGEFGFKNGNLKKDYYKEGIFVGYKYFDAKKIECECPFGYGLSYTDFSQRLKNVETNLNSVKVTVSVKNIGNTYSGKSVVLLFAWLPQDSSLKKETRRLVAFAKTKELAPNQEEDIDLVFDAKSLASFDSAKGQWLLQKGLYGLSLSYECDEKSICALLKLEADCLLEKTSAICPLQEELPEIPLQGEKWAVAKDLPSYDFAPTESFFKADSINSCTAKAKDLVSKIKTEELIPLLYGVDSSDVVQQVGAVATSTPGSAGQTTASLQSYGIPSALLADGPAGLRLAKEYQADKDSGKIYFDGISQSICGGFFAQDHHRQNTVTRYQYCTAFPVGTLLAQSWNLELLKEVGLAVAREMKEFNINFWLAPGMNIQRNPLCGRNFEYYSEDPLVSGKCAAAITSGVQEKAACFTTIKHYACNNQEDNRVGVDVVVSERALREVYLRGFEIAVKESQPGAIMTSYNLINGLHSANNNFLCTDVARKEWGFKGLIMTDWATTFDFGGSLAWKCIKAGNDLIMPGSNKFDRDNIKEALKNGDLTEADIRSCAERIVSLLLACK